MKKIKSELSKTMRMLETIVSESQKNQLNFELCPEEFWKAVKALKKLLTLNETEVVLFCLFGHLFYVTGKKPVSLVKIAEFCNSNPISLIPFEVAVSSLEDRGFIINAKRADEKTEGEAFIIDKRFFKIFSLNAPKIIIDNELRIVLKKYPHSSDDLFASNNVKLINPADFPEKTLYYPMKLQTQIEQFTNAIMPEKYNIIKEQLASKKLNGSFCAIFYGEPGTGKTASVYQIAKKTNRDIYKVEMGRLTSKWIGETTENIICELDKYAEAVKDCEEDENIPILFLNEADILFGKRLSSQQGSDNEYNKIQSILLDRIENFEGILIATTNMSENFDKAFERRFLFKCVFEKQPFEIRKKIWQERLDSIDESTAENLARNFEFSAGEIENIASKIIVNECITDKKITSKELFDLCKNEKFKHEEEKVCGFVA